MSFSRKRIRENLYYILRDYLENINKYFSREVKKKIIEIVFLLEEEDYKKMRKYIKEDIFFRL